MNRHGTAHAGHSLARALAAALIGAALAGAAGPPVHAQSAGPSPTNLAGLPNPGDVSVQYNTWFVNGTVLNVTPLTPPAFYNGGSGDITLPQIAFSVLAQRFAGDPTFLNFNILYAKTNLAGVALFAAYAQSVPTVGPPPPPGREARGPVSNASGGAGTGLNFAGGSLLVQVPCLSSGNINDNVSGSVTGNTFTPSATGREYAVFFNDASPQAAYQDYVNYVRGTGTPTTYGTAGRPTGAQFRSDVYSCSPGTPTDPLAGNPQSLQFRFIDQALNPATLGQVEFDQPANLVGVEYGHTSSGGLDGDRVDASYQRAFRIIPGSRALLIVNVPVTFYDVNGKQEVRATGAVGLQYPVTRNWTVQPQVAYGVVSAHSEGISGQSAAATVSSQYALYRPWLGRGRLTIGNMVGYTQVTDVRMAGLPVSRHPGNFVTRDGLAYEYPLKSQFDGRVASLRASYTYTYVDGRRLFLNQSHDVTVSLGVRTRESSLKNSYELLRVGLRGEFGDKYDAVYLFGGYRF